MKLSEFNKPAPPASPGVSPSSPQEPENASLEAPQEEQYYYTSVTPSGIEVAYSPAPRRHYRLRQAKAKYSAADWVEVPSVTTVLGVLDRSGPLTWWGMKVGVEGCIELANRKILSLQGPVENSILADQIIQKLTEHKLTVNHVKDSAADRGVNVHQVLEDWCEDGALPDSNNWPENERGYVEGLYQFLCAIAYVAKDVKKELMVGSLEHSYAGRFDLVLTLSKPVDVVTRCYPKRPPKIESIPAGRWLIDLKTRAKPNVYPSNYMQLEAYELASVECGYEPTDYRAVLVVTPDGKYQLSVNHDWTADDFLAVRKTFQVMNERGVVQALRDELDAKEVSNG